MPCSSSTRLRLVGESLLEECPHRIGDVLALIERDAPVDDGIDRVLGKGGGPQEAATGELGQVRRIEDAADAAAG